MGNAVDNYHRISLAIYVLFAGMIFISSSRVNAQTNIDLSMLSPISPANAGELAELTQIDTRPDGAPAGLFLLDAKISPDNRLVATRCEDLDVRSASGSFIQIWDIETQSLLQTLSSQADFVDFTLSPDGRYLIALDTPFGVTLWETETGHMLQGWNEGLDAVFHPTENILALVVDTSETVSSVTNSNAVILWDVELMEEISRVEASVVTRLNFSPDGRLLAIGGLGEVELWELSNIDAPMLLNTFQGTRFPISSITFSSNGDILVFEDEPNQMRLWNIPTNEEINVVVSRGAGLAGMPLTSRNNVRILGYLDDGHARLFNIETGEELAYLPDEGTILDLNHGEDIIAMLVVTDMNAQRGTVVLRDVNTGDSVAMIEENSFAKGLEFSQNDRFLITWNAGGIIKFWGISE